MHSLFGADVRSWSLFLRPQTAASKLTSSLDEEPFMHFSMSRLTIPFMLIAAWSVLGATAQSQTGFQARERQPAAAPIDAKRTIRVTGRGEVRAAPDVARIVLGVETQSPTASAALTENSQAMSDLLDELKAQEVAEDDIQTVGFSVSPQYDDGNSRSSREAFPQIVAYRAANRIQVAVRNLDKLGQILDAAVRVGANQIHNVQFDIGNRQPLEDKARQIAMADANRKARVLADAATGVSLGRLLQAAEHGAVPIQGRESMMFQAASSVPIAQGELTVAVQVDATFAIASE